MNCVILLFCLSVVNSEEYLKSNDIAVRMHLFVDLFNGIKADSISSNAYQIGNSTLGRNLYAYCLGNCNSHSSSVLFFGGIHGREGFSVMTSVNFVQKLFDRVKKQDPETISFLKNRMIWIICSLNPDSYDLNIESRARDQRTKLRAQYGLKRKNMKVTCPRDYKRSKYDEDGIDINRNFPVCFDVDELGSSSIPCRDDYRGPYPLSEAESKSLRFFLDSIQIPSMAVSLHGYGRTVLHPYSCKSLSSSLNASTLHQFSEAVNDIISDTNHTYTTGQAWNLSGLYSVNGDAIDYLYSVYHIPAFSVELPPDYPQHDEMNGFWPNMAPLQDESYNLLWNMVKMAGCNLRMSATTITNRGFGICDDVEIHSKSSKTYIGRILPFVTKAVSLGNDVVIRSKDQVFLFNKSVENITRLKSFTLDLPMEEKESLVMIKSKIVQEYENSSIFLESPHLRTVLPTKDSISEDSLHIHIASPTSIYSHTSIIRSLLQYQFL